MNLQTCTCGRRYNPRSGTECARCRWPRSFRRIDAIAPTECRACGAPLPSKSAEFRGRWRYYCNDNCRKKPNRCACGAFCSGSRCSACSHASKKGVPTGKRLQMKPCRSCGQMFQPKVRHRISCSPECWRTFVSLNSEQKTLKVRLQRRRNSARRYSRVRHIEVGRWRRICERDGYVCWICRELIDPTLKQPHPGAPTCDHVIPVSQGGPDEDSNLKAAHYRCNNRRGAGRTIAA